MVLHADATRGYPATDDPAAEAEREAVELALRTAPVRVDRTYTTPAYHHNPMEPNATVAVWGDQGLVLYDSCPGATAVRETLAELFGLPPTWSGWWCRTSASASAARGGRRPCSPRWRPR